MTCLHSLCISHRYVYPAHTGVLCLDIHPEHPSLIAVGFYDGWHGCNVIMIIPTYLFAPHLMQVLLLCIIFSERVLVLSSVQLLKQGSILILCGRYVHFKIMSFISLLHTAFQCASTSGNHPLVSRTMFTYTYHTLTKSVMIDIWHCVVITDKLTFFFFTKGILAKEQF